MMKRSVYLPDRMASIVERYLRAHPAATFSSLVQNALAHHLIHPRPGRILLLAGLVKKGVGKASSRAEDETIAKER